VTGGITNVAIGLGVEAPVIGALTPGRLGYRQEELVQERREQEMTTTTQTTPPSRTTSTKTRAFPLGYFVLAFAFTWSFWWLAVLEARGLISSLPVPAQALGVFGPLVAAVVLTAWEGGKAELRSLLARIVRWRVPPVWYGVAVLGPVLLYLISMALEVLLGGRPPSPGALVGALPTVLLYAAYMVIFVALGEEVGWRGYALPALQARHGALVSSVILGTMWALWHLPLFFNPDLFYSDLPFVVQLAIQAAYAVLFTWVFNSTGGSVLLAILMHAVLNASGQLWKVMPEYSIEPASAAEAAAQTVHINIMSAVVVGVASVAVVLVYGARNLSRQPRQVSAAASGESQPTREH
jgi:membrane protease YdiL (CAAX protease family)